MTVLKIQAIQTALNGNWDDAISLNQELLKSNPHDIDALNRLAFAYSITGKPKDARLLYQKVLEIDKLNAIALRGLKRLVGSPTVQKNAISRPVHTQDHMNIISISTLFLEETGKTKVVELINVCDIKTLTQLRTGESIQLNIKRSKIFALDQQKQYIGMLPDNIGKRLLKFMNGGNLYESYIKSTSNNHIALFIREIKRANRFKNQPSFLASDKSHFVVERHPQTHTKQNDSVE